MKGITIILFMFFSAFSNASKSDFFDVIEYGAGIYGSIYIHELGHAATAKYFGATDMEINVPQKNGGFLSGETLFKMSNNTPFKSRVISASGLIASNLASELVLQVDGLHTNQFAQSIFATGQISNVMHVYRYYTEIRGKNGYGSGNDIDHYEMSGGNPHIFSALLIGYTFWAIKRASDKNIPIFGVSINF